MNNLRSTLLVAVTAFVAAACGDKVTVAPITTPTSVVTSVTVAPASATLNIGDQITLTAAVNAGAGLATTVTWASSDATKASVDANGNVKGLAATPGVAVCATSTVDTGKKGCASVVVSGNAVIIPATVSIASVTVGGAGGGLNVPVNPAAVAGVIDVKLNIAPGNQTPSRVDLLFGTKVVASQGFTATQAAALRSAADEAVAAQSAFPSVVLSYNTAAFTAAGPANLNGAVTLGAKLYTTQGGATASAANATMAITLANADTYIATVATTGTTANANSAAGFRFDRGGLAISVTPIIYTGAAVGTATVFYGSAANCDASGLGQRTIALTAPAAGSTAWTATLPQTIPAGGAAVNTVNNYEFNAGLGVVCAAANATGEGITVTATNAAGNALFAAAAPAAGNTFRLDNRGPGAPTFNANPNGRQNGWINASVLTSASGAGSAATNRWMISGAADAGVGGYRAGTRVAAPSATGTVSLALAATRDTLNTIPAPTATQGSLCAVASATDLLGNESTLPASATVCNAPVVATSTGVGTGLSHQLFGVDIAAPTIAFAGGLASNARLNGASVGAEFQVTVSDTGIVGNSGMLSGSSVVGTVILRNASGASPVCFVGTVSAAGVCNPASVNAAPAYPLVPTTVVAASVTNAYYTYTAASQDAAGNQSAVVTRVVVYDNVVPALTTALFNTPLNGPSVTFNANSSDNLDLRDVTYSLTYAGGLAGPIVYPAVVLNTFNVAPLVNTNVPAGITIANFVRQVENVTANAPVTVGGQFKPTGISGNARDQGGNLSGAVATAIPGPSVTTGVSYLTAAAPLLINSWAITNAATNVSDGNVVAPVVPANALSVTLNADAFGPTATFNPPFARVDFYAVVGGNLVQIGSATTYSTVDNGAAFGRRHRYSITWTPGTSAGLGAINIYAIGVNAVGDALVSPVNANITVTNP